MEQRRVDISAAPSDTEAILKELISPQSKDSASKKISKLSRNERKEVKGVLVGALQGLISRLDVNSSIASEEAVKSAKNEEKLGHVDLKEAQAVMQIEELDRSP